VLLLKKAMLEINYWEIEEEERVVLMEVEVVGVVGIEGVKVGEEVEEVVELKVVGFVDSFFCEKKFEVNLV